MNIMQDWKTLTGLTLGEAINRMAEILPPAAYKKVPGAADLTDIDPAHLTETATKVFGPCGIGWAFHYDPANLEVRWVERTKRSGDVYETYEAELKQLTLRYAYVADDTVRWSEPIPANGGVDNENRGYAERGSLTNAIGAAFAKLCWQLLVYKGVVDHTNAAELFKKQQEKKSAAPKTGGDNGSQPEGGSKPAAEAVAETTTATATAEKSTGDSKAQVGGNGHNPAPQAKPDSNGASGNGHKPAAPTAQPDPNDPANFVINIGKNEGKKLGEVNPDYVQWYATQMASTPKNLPLINAAKAFLERHPVAA